MKKETYGEWCWKNHNPAKLTDEKRNVLDDLTDLIKERYVADDLITTRMMLDIIIRKCENLKHTDF